VAINKDEVGIFTENIAANISVHQNLKFCGNSVKNLRSFGWKNVGIIVKHQDTVDARYEHEDCKTPIYIYGNKIFTVRVSMKNKFSIVLIQNKNKPFKNYVQRWER